MASRRSASVLGGRVALPDRGWQDPPTQAGCAAVLVTDREDDALAEPVVEAPTVLARAGEPDFGKLLCQDLPPLVQGATHLVPARGRPAELVRLDRGIRHAPPAEVVECGLPRLRLREHGVVEGNRRLHDVALPRLPDVVTPRPLVQLDAGLARQVLQCLDERDPVALHHEAEDVAAQAAAEAVPAVAGRGHHERRRLLAVERAEPLVRGAGLLQADRLADYVDDVQPTLHFGRNADCQTASSLPPAERGLRRRPPRCRPKLPIGRTARPFVRLPPVPTDEEGPEHD